MTEYLIELHPADFFFFANDRINHPNVKDAYYTRSAYYPQQTGLLGMLRYQLLLQNGATEPGLVSIPTKNGNLTRAENLIGKESFNATAGQSFGAIRKISPLFLTQRGENGTRRYLHTVPLTEGLAFEKQQPAVRAVSLNGRKKDFLPWLPAYKSKVGLAEGLIDDKGKRFRIDEIFRETERTGIKKSEDGTPDTGAFYRQLVRGLRDGYAFAFFTTLDDTFKSAESADPEPVKLGNATVSLGAERSAFFMKVVPRAGISFGDTLPEKLKTATSQVACISDTFLPDDLPDDLFDFLVGETTLFNNLKTLVSQANFYAKPDLNTASRYLLRRGSVFFTSRKTELLKKLEGEKPWTNIGFNHCI